MDLSDFEPPISQNFGINTGNFEFPFDISQFPSQASNSVTFSNVQIPRWNCGPEKVIMPKDFGNYFKGPLDLPVRLLSRFQRFGLPMNGFTSPKEMICDLLIRRITEKAYEDERRKNIEKFRLKIEERRACFRTRVEEYLKIMKSYEGYLNLLGRCKDLETQLIEQRKEALPVGFYFYWCLMVEKFVRSTETYQPSWIGILTRNLWNNFENGDSMVDVSKMGFEQLLKLKGIIESSIKTIDLLIVMFGEDGDQSQKVELMHELKKYIEVAENQIKNHIPDEPKVSRPLYPNYNKPPVTRDGEFHRKYSIPYYTAAIRLIFEEIRQKKEKVMIEDERVITYTRRHYFLMQCAYEAESARFNNSYYVEVRDSLKEGRLMPEKVKFEFVSQSYLDDLLCVLNGYEHRVCKANELLETARRLIKKEVDCNQENILRYTAEKPYRAIYEMMQNLTMKLLPILEKNLPSLPNPPSTMTAISQKSFELQLAVAREGRDAAEAAGKQLLEEIETLQKRL